MKNNNSKNKLYKHETGVNSATLAPSSGQTKFTLFQTIEWWNYDVTL